MQQLHGYMGDVRSGKKRQLNFDDDEDESAMFESVAVSPNKYPKSFFTCMFPRLIS